jgi:hypothetical protein
MLMQNVLLLRESTSRKPGISKLLAITFLCVVAVSAGSRANASSYDGPAELPRVLLQTAMANTPAPGITMVVKPGESLQAALNNAKCGDTIMLEAGATFTGLFTFPNKSCDDAHWIIVRTSSDNSLLPSQTSRVTPCYAGVSSLPGRPAFNCISTRNVLAKVVMNIANASGPIVFAAGANHYRLIGLELTRVTGIGLVEALAGPAGHNFNSKIIYDRVWFHGTVHDDTVRGVQLGGSTYVSVINSFFTDFHCAAGGACSDAQAISGGIWNHPMGPYKIYNNFLEAAGENVIFGGGEATYTPADIEIRHNHFFKPLIWLKGQPGYVGGTNGHPFVVKNLLEFKNAQRVLAEGNIMEYTWGGFSQSGFAVLLTPKNPSNLCPKCMVTDITIRYSRISHMGSGLQIANVLAGTYGALDGERYSIHDVVMDDINPVKYHGSGQGTEIMTVRGTALLRNVSINHITAFPPSTSFSIGNTTGNEIPNLVVTNNLIVAGAYPVWSTGGGTANCAYYDEPLTTFNACFSPYSFKHNGMIASPSSYPPSRWPSGNYFPATTNFVQFVNYNGGSTGNYQLLSSSPYKNAGSDGKDLGADMTELNGAIAGVK